MAGLEGLLAGRVLGGRYLIEEVIGRGGMGAVYRALDERLGRRVAIKVITLIGSDPEGVERMRARFHREARAAAALPHHPNIVPVYDYGTDETLGLDYIVMELLRGSDLATRIARSDPPPLATALRILLQAARGIAVGHRAGLIHRDVKPGNIFLSEADQAEMQVRVVDFGIAKLVDDEDTFNQLTQDGRVPHSPAFASPEQLRGLTKLTPASDVFSLGAVGYLLLTGERPFADADRNRMSLGMSAPAPILRNANPAIPAGVEVVIQKALSYDPLDRYPDAGAFLEALEAAVRGIADNTIEPYVGDPFRPTARPTPRRVAAEEEDDRTRLMPDGGAAGVGAGGAVSMDDDDRTRIMDASPGDDRTLLTPPTAPPPPPPPLRESGGRAGAAPASAAAPQPQPRKKSGLALIVWTVVLLGLAAVAVWAWMESQRPVEVTEEIPPAPDSIPNVEVPQVEVDPLQTDRPGAFVMNEEGRRYFAMQQYDSALKYFSGAAEIVPDEPAYRRNLGLTYRFLGRYEEAVTHLRRATELDPTDAVAFGHLAYAQLAAGDTVAALQNFDRFVDRSAGREDLALYRREAIEKSREIRQAQQRGTTGDSLGPLPVPDPVQPSQGEGPSPVVPAGGEL